jgi:hypothetical protein
MSLDKDRYAPDAPEGESRGGGYVSRKDVKWIAATLIVLAIVFVPIWNTLREQSERQRCRQNMKAMSEAIAQYAIDNNDRFPPAYNMSDTDAPGLGYAYPATWATHVQPLMNPRASFRCPSAGEDEVVNVLAGEPGKPPIDLTYGMYKGLSAVPSGMVPNPGEVVLLAETANNGAAGSFNPVPFRDAGGKVVTSDGFLIGWSDSNLLYGDQSETVTRLAFRGTQDGTFDGPDVRGRHGKIIHAISAEGGLIQLTPSQAKVDYLYPTLRGRWWANSQIYR